MASYRGRFIKDNPNTLPDSVEPMATKIPELDDEALLNYEPVIFSREEFNPPAAQEAPTVQPDAIRFTPEDLGLTQEEEAAEPDLAFSFEDFDVSEPAPAAADSGFDFTLSDFLQPQADQPEIPEEIPASQPEVAEEAPPMDYTFSEFVLPEMKEPVPQEELPQQEPEVPAFQPPVRRRPRQEQHKKPAARKAPAKKAAPRKTEKQPAPAAAAEAQEPPRNPRRKSRKKYWNRSFLLLYLFLAAALPELLLHVSTATEGNLLNSGLFLSVLFAAVPALIVYGITLLIPNKKVNFGICVGYSALYLLLCGSQRVYFAIFGTYYSAYSMVNGGDAFQFVDAIFAGIFSSLVTILLMAIPLVFLCVLGRKNFSFKKMKHWQSGVAPIAAGLVLQVLLVLCLPIFGGTGAMSAYDLYHNTADAYAGINKLGLTTGFRVDLVRMITGESGSGSLDLGEPDDTTASSLPEESTTVPNTNNGPNVLDINFKSLINRTNNKNVQEMHQYFMNREPSNKNEKTGMFEGCNLILITAEGFSDLAVTKERTPTLYKLMNEGFNFTNYYVSNWGVSTTDGEYAFLTGTVPKSNCWSFYRTADVKGEENLMPLTMAQQLIAKGYGAYAYHGHDYDYYHRDLYLENLGYQYKARDYGLDMKFSWPSSDVDVVNASINDYLYKDEPFTAYYMTISGHLKYTFKGNAMSARNKDLVADEPYSDNVKAYLACQLEFEKSMTLLLEKLEEAGKLENTVIVITADHYPYGLENSEISELLGHEVETNFELYENQCIIYKAGMTPEVIDEPCSSLDLLPTISNLFGLEFDSRLYMGRDIFSDAEPFVMFLNRSWITDKAMYNASTKKVTSLTGEEISNDYVKAHTRELNNRFTISARILDYDYWRILFGK